MTDEPLDAGSEAGLLEGSALDDEGAACSAPPPELVALSFLAGNFFTAFVQTLGQRAADGSVKLPKRVSELLRTRVRKRGRADEFRIGVRDGSAATIAITADTPMRPGSPCSTSTSPTTLYAARHCGGTACLGMAALSYQ